MPNWKEYKLGDISLDVAMGPFGSNLKADNFIPKGVPVIRGGNLNKGGFEDKYFVFVSEEKAKSLKRSLAYPNDLVFTHRGTIGQVGIIPHSKYPYYLVSQSQMRLTVNKDYLNPRYLYYWFQSATGQYELLKNSAQVGVPSIASPTKSLKEIDIKLPDVITQNTIAEILSSLDDKIELNNQINKELEALAQALFKQWFIDFEFPNENGQPYKSSGGEMVESELGEIPKGWRVSEFNNHLDTTRGLSYKGSGLTDISSGVPMVNLNSVYEGGGYKFEGLKYYSGDYKERHLIKPWDLAVANTEQGHKYLLIGYPAFVPKQVGEFGLFSHHIYRVRTKQDSPLSNQFFYYLMLQPSVREQIIGACNGTTVNMLKIDGLERPKFIEPLKEYVTRFSILISDIWESKENIYSESNELKRLRDTLLPKLISGELEVSEALTEKVM